MGWGGVGGVYFGDVWVVYWDEGGEVRRMICARQVCCNLLSNSTYGLWIWGCVKEVSVRVGATRHYDVYIYNSPKTSLPIV